MPLAPATPSTPTPVSVVPWVPSPAAQLPNTPVPLACARPSTPNAAPRASTPVPLVDSPCTPGPVVDLPRTPVPLAADALSRPCSRPGRRCPWRRRPAPCTPTSVRCRTPRCRRARPWTDPAVPRRRPCRWPPWPRPGPRSLGSRFAGAGAGAVRRRVHRARQHPVRAADPDRVVVERDERRGPEMFDEMRVLSAPVFVSSMCTTSASRRRCWWCGLPLRCPARPAWRTGANQRRGAGQTGRLLWESVS